MGDDDIRCDWRLLIALFVFGGVCAIILISVVTLIVIRQVPPLVQEGVYPRRERASESTALVDQYRASVCYIYTSYKVHYFGRTTVLRQSGGTGFVVGSGLIATNRHVIEPWWENQRQQMRLRAGALFRVSKILAFFPGRSEPVTLSEPLVSSTSDVALVHFSLWPGHVPAPLPLADLRPALGEPVIVLGYPAGVSGMVASSSPNPRIKVSPAMDLLTTMHRLAATSRIRPLATYGHLGDVTDEALIYDAHTAPGGSGGPVLNYRGEVVGINAAFMEHFIGGNIGVPVSAIKPLIKIASHYCPVKS
jgi:S1-C subfamily serine protease